MWIIADDEGCRMVRFSAAFMRLCACLSVFPHDVSKTDAAKITKLKIRLKHVSWKPIYFGVKRSKTKITRLRFLHSCECCLLVFRLNWTGFHNRIITRYMAKPGLSPPGILLFWTVPLHNTCQSLPAVCYITSMQCLPMRKFRGWAKLASCQPFSAVSGCIHNLITFMHAQKDSFL